MNRYLVSVIIIGLFAGNVVAAESAPKQPEAKPGIGDEVKLSEAAAAHLKILPTDYVMGSRKAKVTILEYASLSCPHCADFEMKILPKIYDKYIKPGKVNLVFRDFPLNEPALRASMLARCAAASSLDKKEETYYRYIKVLFSSQKTWAIERDFKGMLQKIAMLGGVGKEAFDKCMADTALENAILEGRKKGADLLKVESTPTIYVGSKRVDGSRPFEQLVGIIEEQLKAK